MKNKTTKLDKIKRMVRNWLKDADETCLDRLAQIYGEELTMLERAGAGLDGDKEASEIYEAFDVALKKEYAASEG